MVGTFRYMAPEQFNGGEADARSDIFAYGLIFYELLTGVHPFYAAEAARQMYNTLNVEQVPIDELRTDCPSELQGVVSRLLEKDPELRYQTLDDVLFDIEPALIALRRARAGELVEEARAAKEQEQLGKAQITLREALELDPGFERARELREQIQTEVRRQAIRPKIDDLIRRGQQALAVGNPTEAMERFESAIKLDPTDTTLKAMLEEARLNAHKLREANRLSSEGFKALHTGDFSAAARLATQAVELVPAHAAARRLLAHSQAALAEEHKRICFADSLVCARRLIKGHSWSEATALLDELRSAYPKEGEVEDLLSELRATQEKVEREQALASGLTSARHAIQVGELQNALAYLEELVPQYPESGEVENTLAFVRSELAAQDRRISIQSSRNLAEAAAATQDFSRAVRIIEEALDRYPGDQELQREYRRLVAEQREAVRRELVENVLAAANALRSGGHLGDAVEVLDAFLRDHGTEGSVLEFRNDIAKEHERALHRIELHKFVHRANQLLERGHLHEAQQFLRDPPPQLRDHPQVTQLFGELHVRQQAARKDTLTGFLSETRTLIEKAAFDQAFDLTETFTGQLGDDPEIEAARAGVQDAEQDANDPAAKLIPNATRMLRTEPDTDALNEEILQIVERQLASLIGPLARVLVRRAAAKASSILELYSFLARELEREEDRETFLANRNSLVPEQTRARYATQAPTDAAPVTDLPPPHPTVNEITPSEIEQAGRVLAPYLGPIAVVLARKEAKRVGNLESLYAALAEHLVERAERDHFLKQAETKHKVTSCQPHVVEETARTSSGEGGVNPLRSLSGERPAPTKKN
jgi:hypothetical protein